MAIKIRYLPGTRVVPLAVVSWHPAMDFAFEQVYYVYQEVLGRHPVLTGAQEDAHSDGSLHFGRGEDPRCRAADFDDDDINGGQKVRMRAMLVLRLGSQFDVIWETQHLHIEYQYRP